MTELSVWMLEGSFNVAVRPRSHVMHFSSDEDRLLCRRILNHSDYVLVDTVEQADIQPIMRTYAAGQYGCFYRPCKACMKHLPTAATTPTCAGEEE